MPVLLNVHLPEVFPCSGHLGIGSHQDLKNDLIQDQLVVADAQHFSFACMDRFFVMDDYRIDGRN